jgi:hypothetical protein
MKMIFSLLALILLCSFAPDQDPGLLAKSPIVAALLAGLYEIAVRLIPTVKDYTILGKVLKGLKWLSDFLNLKRL